jgi:hypothetical protein
VTRLATQQRNIANLVATMTRGSPLFSPDPHMKISQSMLSRFDRQVKYDAQDHRSRDRARAIELSIHGLACLGARMFALQSSRQE